MSKENKKILVTGGAGYVGTHCVVELVNAGYEVVVLDNFSNSKKESIQSVEKIVGRTVEVFDVDVNNFAALEQVFEKHRIHTVVHLAGLRAKVTETFENPLSFYESHVSGTVTLLKCMKNHGVANLVYSSSSLVYGNPEAVPIHESDPVVASRIANSYGKAHYIVEQILQDFAQAQHSNVIVLRYFDAVGAHESGLIGEDVQGAPTNLAPCACQVSLGIREKIFVWGNDHDTPDGTGIRDYIHVHDVAHGHVCAVKKCYSESSGFKVYNLASSRKGYSVMEVIKAMERASGKAIAYAEFPKRPELLSVVYADASLAREELGWSATKDLNDMCQDMWKWCNKPKIE